MPDPAEELAQLRSQIRQLESRIASLEQRSPQISPRRTTQESRFGLTAVNRIGAFTLAIGIAFFFKYAVDNLYIAARGRVALGLMAALLLLIAGEWLHRRGQHTFAQGIAGCGIAIFYISVSAASGWYALISPGASVVAVSVICAGAIALSFRYVNSAIAVIGILGGILTPLLLHAGTPHILADATYLFVLDVTCINIALRRPWLYLIPTIAGAAMLAAWILFDARDPQAFTNFTFAIAAVHAIATLRGSGLLRNTLYYVTSGALITGALRELGIWATANVPAVDRGSVVSELGSLLLAICGVATLIYGITRASAMNRNLALVLLALVIGKLYLWDVWFLQHVYRTTAFVTLGALLLGASWIYSRSRPARP